MRVTHITQQSSIIDDDNQVREAAITARIISIKQSGASSLFPFLFLSVLNWLCAPLRGLPAAERGPSPPSQRTIGRAVSCRVAQSTMGIEDDR